MNPAYPIQSIQQSYFDRVFCDLNYFSNVHRGRVSPARFNLVGNRGCSWKSGDNVAVKVGYKVAAAGRKKVYQPVI